MLIQVGNAAGIFSQDHWKSYIFSYNCFSACMFVLSDGCWIARFSNVRDLDEWEKSWIWPSSWSGPLLCLLELPPWPPGSLGLSCPSRGHFRFCCTLTKPGLDSSDYFRLIYISAFGTCPQAAFSGPLRVFTVLAHLSPKWPSLPAR